MKVKTLMKQRTVEALALLQERRRFGRIHVSEPRICQVYMPQSQDLWTNQGILLNISLGGLYFLCDEQPPLEKNDIRYLTLDTPSPAPKTHQLGFRVLVVRTDHGQDDLPQFGVALRIISDPIYCRIAESDDAEITSVDKPRLLYQHYHLNQKAYEIIINTPEIRADKIANIKEYIDEGYYEAKFNEITQSIIKGLLLKK
jgi:hypothetical protein